MASAGPRRSSAGSQFGSQETALTGTDSVRDLLKGPDQRRLPRRNQAGGPKRLMLCRKSKIIFQDHNMPLSWENVELRGFEPLTFCMPCLQVSSGGVSLGCVSARQGNGLVWQSLPASAVVWGALPLGSSLVTGLFRAQRGPRGRRHRQRSGATPGLAIRLRRT